MVSCLTFGSVRPVIAQVGPKVKEKPRVVIEIHKIPKYDIDFESGLFKQFVTGLSFEHRHSRELG